MGRFKPTGKTAPAQITFVQSERGDQWRARLLAPPERVIDMSDEIDGKFAGFVCLIKGEGEQRRDGLYDHYSFFTQGGSRHGRRHRWARDLTTAQEECIAWAKRRFRVSI